MRWRSFYWQQHEVDLEAKLVARFGDQSDVDYRTKRAKYLFSGVGS
jgi:hypothetical protein